MENFFLDNPDIKFHLENMDLKKIIELKENNFSDVNNYLDTPADYNDAMDNYTRILELMGEISGEYIAPYTDIVDKTGAVFSNGIVTFAKETEEAVERIRKAELMGFTTPRKYGGLNMPKIIYSMAIELISRADASIMTIFGLQEIAETIHKFGTEEQCENYLPRFCSGEILGAMALTEPDAGSDLPAARLKAFQDEKGKWYLNGVKRFITNGCAEVILVMARSENDIMDARGLSLFIYERDENMKIRRIEDKLGIHGSPTCELQFNNAEAELLGQRKRGLIKYTMSLMNGARVGISAQAVGIAEAAYREASKYAANRIQFGKPINQFPPVYEMLTDMKVNIEAARVFLYESSCMVDMKEGIENQIKINPEKKVELKPELRRYSNYESLFTPILKCFTTEMGNKLCYDALQIHGGVGYTREFAIERICRDMRITSIYEGTSQLQVVAAIGGLLKGTAAELLNEYENTNDFSSIKQYYKKIKYFKEQLNKAVTFVKEQNDAEYTDYHARRIVDIGADTIISYLLCMNAIKSEKKKKTAELFISKAEHRINAALNYILTGDRSLIEIHDEFI